jgi:proteasome lid subunit RPN8/RPN11
MGFEIAMTSKICAIIVEEAARAYPLEACGLLLGGADGVLAQVVPCANVAPDPARHFEIDPAALIAALRAERGGGVRVLGYYHSHPSGKPAPSPIDAAMAARDGRIWAIVAGGRIGWFRDGGNGFEVLSTRAVEG